MHLILQVSKCVPHNTIIHKLPLPHHLLSSVHDGRSEAANSTDLATSCSPFGSGAVRVHQAVEIPVILFTQL